MSRARRARPRDAELGVKDRFAERVDELIEREVRARRRAELLRWALPVIYTSMAYLAILGGLAFRGVRAKAT